MCGDEDERAAFVRALVEAATDPRGSAVIVIAVRADFYGRCASYPELVSLLGASHVLVGPMTAEEYARAIEQPARRAGLVIDPELVRRLVSEVVDEPGALPLLSAALLELWQHRRGRAIPWEIYEQTGGVRGAVARLAEDAFGRLDEGGRDVARALFLRLVGQSEGETVVRRRAPLEEFDVERDEVFQVLSVLTDARLVTVSEGTVEVAHEALLREWPRLQTWLEEDRAGQRLRHHITGAAVEWDAAGQDAGELYRGARLASALDWTADHTLELNELERRFLAESRAASERDAERQRRTNRRLRGLLAGVAVLLALALVAGGLALVQRGRAEEAATAATAQRLGAQALVQGDLDLSLLLAREGVNLDDSLETRGNLLAALERSPAAIGIMRPLPGRLLAISSDPTGPNVLVTNNAGQLAVVDPAQGRVLQVVQARFGYYEANGEIVVLQENGFGRLDPSTGDVTPLVESPSDWTGAFTSSPDLRTFGFTVSGGSGLRFVDTTTGAVQHTWHADPGRAFIDAWFDTDGRHVLTVEADSPLPADFFQVQGVTYVWRDLATGRAITTIPDPNGYETIERPQGRELAVGHLDGGVTVYDLATGTSRDLSGRHNGSVDGIAFSPDGATLVTVGGDDQAIVMDLATGTIRESLQGHNGPVHGAAFSPDGNTLYTSSLDGSLMSWDLAGDRRIDHPFRASGGVPQLPAQSFPSFDVSPDGSQIADAQAGGSVNILDGTTRELIRTIHVGPPGGVLDVVFSPDGKVLATGGENGLVTLWDTSSWERLGAPLSGPSRSTDPNASESVFAVAFSPDGRTLAAGSELATGPPGPNEQVPGDGHVYIWSLTTRELVGPSNMVSGAADVLDVAFSPDGSELAAAFDAFGSGDQTLTGGYARVWQLPSGKELYTVNVDGDYGHSDAVTFSPDGGLLVTGGGTGDLRFFDARTGAKDGKSVLASAGWVLSEAFDPSGTTIVTAGSDGTTRMIDLASRAQIGPALPGIDNTGEFARFTPDGTQVIVVYDSGRGYVWDVTPSAWKRRACSVAGRQLTRTEWSTFLPDDPYRPVCPG